MPTGSKTEQYYDLVGQPVSTFSTMSHRKRLPLSHRIRPPAWGGQRGQEGVSLSYYFRCLANRSRNLSINLCSTHIFQVLSPVMQQYRKIFLVIVTGKTGVGMGGTCLF